MKTVNKVAINTIVQYISLVLNVLFGLVSVRFILNALGASDYGVYDLIAGVVALLGFITSTLSQTSMRFLSVSLGEGNVNQIRKTFSICLWLHIYIGLFLSLVLFSLGFFLFDDFLNIPENRVDTARYIYYIMIANLFISIGTTPFSALLCSHENFIYTSIIKILDSIFKLLIAIAITYISSDKLLLYGILMFIITLFNTFCHIMYAIYKYKSQISFVIVPLESMTSVFGFAGWTILDVLGTLASRQGYAVLINNFFGTVANASFALSRQIEGHMYTISASVINTMKPQILKSQGAGDTERMFRLSTTAGKLGFSMMALVAVPLLVMMPDILTIWLNKIPENTIVFSRLMVLACMFEQLTRGLVYANQAIGNIKWFSVTISLIRIMALPISWCYYKMGSPAYTAIVVFLICETIGSFFRVFILHKIAEYNYKKFIKMTLFQIIPPFIFSVLFCMITYKYVSNSIWGIMVTTSTTCLFYMILQYSLGLNSAEKKTIKTLITSVLNRFYK